LRSQFASGYAPLARDAPATDDPDDLASRLVASQWIFFLEVQTETSSIPRFEIHVSTHRDETLVGTLERAHRIVAVKATLDSVVLEQSSVDFAGKFDAGWVWRREPDDEGPFGRRAERRGLRL
ncbi:MAG TPA: hypothetical protein VNP02_00585, partial [Gammaproteobacteria bacterium]|nr:hypothetical protein [Gammaproteobacteria bacterium]